MRTIVGIDPGASGGIAVFHRGNAKAVAMPSDVKKLNEYLIYLKETYDRPLVFIEKVQAWIKDDEEGGKKFGINKMLASYEKLLTVLKINDFPFVQVYPVSWQSQPGIQTKEKDKTLRKNHFKDYAQSTFPEVSVTLATADALCLIIFGTNKIQNDTQWIVDKVENINKNELKLKLL